MKERLQKILAAAGVASRREAEELIRAGVVSVNGTRVSIMGYKADPVRDVIMVRGQKITSDPLRTIMLNKPRGVVTTMDDPEGRSSVADLIADEPARLFPVGRLDRRSEGLLLMTNDGELAQLLTHPKYGVAKVYHVETSREVTVDDQVKLAKGIMLDDGPTLPIAIEPLPLKMGIWYKIIISEGRNRQIRRMFEALGYYVARLRRVQVGSLRLGDLKPGEKRVLTRFELERLRRSALGKVKGGVPGDSSVSTSEGDRRRSRSSRNDGGLERRILGSSRHADRRKRQPGKKAQINR